MPCQFERHARPIGPDSDSQFRRTPTRRWRGPPSANVPTGPPRPSPRASASASPPKAKQSDTHARRWRRPPKGDPADRYFYSARRRYVADRDLQPRAESARPRCARPSAPIAIPPSAQPQTIVAVAFDIAYPPSLKKRQGPLKGPCPLSAQLQTRIRKTSQLHTNTDFVFRVVFSSTSCPHPHDPSQIV